jgi:IclR family acetate operon transcriptional repressor
VKPAHVPSSPSGTADLRSPTAVSPSERRRYPSPGAAIAVDVLITLSLKAPLPLRLRELARLLGIPRSTIHRVLQTLEAKGMVTRVDSAGYLIGEETRHLGTLYRIKELPRIAEPILQEVHAQTGESVNLAIAQDDAMLIIATVQSSERLRTVSTVGTRDPFHASALGKAYLAALADEHLTKLKMPLIALSPKTITTRATLLRDLQRSRERGFSIDDEETLLGVRCVGAAILGEGKAPIGALSVMGPTSRLRPKEMKTMGTLVVRAAARISGLLGA